jgi:HSP20 family protein
MTLPTRTNGETVRSQDNSFDRFFNADFARFDPFTELSSARRTMNSLLDSVLRPALGSVQGPQTWVPAVNLSEKDGSYKIECAAPGLKKDDIDIEVADNRLTISAKREEEKDEADARYLYREVRRGGFSRTIAFPDDIDADHVAAKYENGVLELTVPLIKTIQARKVQIRG